MLLQKPLINNYLCQNRNSPALVLADRGSCCRPARWLPCRQEQNVPFLPLCKWSASQLCPLALRSGVWARCKADKFLHSKSAGAFSFPWTGLLNWTDIRNWHIYLFPAPLPVCFFLSYLTTSFIVGAALLLLRICRRHLTGHILAPPYGCAFLWFLFTPFYSFHSVISTPFQRRAA